MAKYLDDYVRNIWLQLRTVETFTTSAKEMG